MVFAFSAIILPAWYSWKSASKVVSNYPPRKFRLSNIYFRSKD
ncbi:hypothetical protein CKO_01353 [Citrobacter koseri ATCC BAA-895]|uniref:Uncharacterized protein n=1 Tax=Citrobacter koseri (strain ATCC BAA-895 / CDC 4225-83 / SGSC4696) TaxID=290338 RepID=A8AG77_CITK8|nr:hypothetical protein CKO_01353 [Citrobacter koseri ATCC BAA-895]